MCFQLWSKAALLLDCMVSWLIVYWPVCLLGCLAVGFLIGLLISGLVGCFGGGFFSYALVG